MNEVEGDDRDQHQHRPDHRIKHEFHRRINAPFAAPDTDQEIHRDQHHFPKDVEEKQIQRGENADHAGLDQEHENEIFMLLLETGMIGVFASLDLFLFNVFWEVMLIPMYFLIGVWGGERRVYAAMKFILYTMIGSVLMLVAIIALYFIHGDATGTFTFSFPQIQSAIASGRIVLSPKIELWLFLAF